MGHLTSPIDTRVLKRSLYSPNNWRRHAICLKKRNATEMARPQGGFTPKPGKERNSGPDKMRMSHLRLRKDIKRIEVEQAKAAALEIPKAKRK
jgi:hypothetical protein